MAQVIEVDSDLVLELSLLERLGAFHSSLRVPKSSLISIHQIPNPWGSPGGLQGIRAPGTGFPGLIMLGTLRSKVGKDFAAVYGCGSARVYEFSHGQFRRWIVSDPRTLKA